MSMALARMRDSKLERPSALKDNSEPWAPEPDSVEAAIAISDQIEALMREWHFK